METLEHFAGIILYVRQLSGEKGLLKEQINELYKVRSDVFGKKNLGYLGEGYCGEKANEQMKDDEKPSSYLNKVIVEITLKVLEEIKCNNLSLLRNF